MNIAIRVNLSVYKTEKLLSSVIRGLYLCMFLYCLCPWTLLKNRSLVRLVETYSF